MKPFSKPRYRRKNSARKFRQVASELVPGADPSLDAVFGRIGVPADQPFTPDPFQKEAVAAIETSDCLVTAPTGAGKTWIAETVTRNILENQGKAWYATPLKALTNSIHSRFVSLFGKDRVGILTGDIKENQDADIIIGTTEILRNQLYDAMYRGKDLDCDVIILDEAHFLGDLDRGVVWEEIMIYLPARIPLLLLSATIGNPGQIAGWLSSIRHKSCKVVETQKRPVPLFPLFLHPSGTLLPLLEKTKNPSGTTKRLHKKVYTYVNSKKALLLSQPGKLPDLESILEIMEQYDLLPAIFFLKSRSECDQAVKLCSRKLLDKDPDRKKALKTALNDLVASHPHLRDHAQRPDVEATGVASHHSGLLPAWKVVVETLMAKGLLHAMFATSTVAAGVNFPARSVVILNSDRFNGTDFMSLSPSEFAQMTGRAGRRGKDHIGFALILPGKYMDVPYVGSLIHSKPVKVDSQIKINFSMVLNLLLSHDPDQIRILLEKSFAAYLLNTSSRKKKDGAVSRKKYGRHLEYLWEDFLDHMEFLTAQGFVTEKGELTLDGLWASKLRIDSPLLVAQAIRKNLLPDNDPALLAAIMGAFVNEKEFRDDPLYQATLPKKLKDIFLDLRQGLKPFALELLKKGFLAPNLFIQPCNMLYAWAHELPWDELMVHADYPEGDFARLTLRTAENLRQLSALEEDFPRLAATARQAAYLILKEPVMDR